MFIFYFEKDAVDLQKVPEPFIETEASLAVVIDEYDPMRPNDYEVVQQKYREDKENERSERSERSERGERSRDRDNDRDRDRCERPFLLNQGPFNLKIMNNLSAMQASTCLWAMFVRMRCFLFFFFVFSQGPRQRSRS